MKKILYICANTIEKFDFFTPTTGEDPSQNTISLVLLHQEQNMDHVPVSQVWILSDSEKHEESLIPQKNISYQILLEEIFTHDLSLVI